jgi:flagellin
MTSILNNIAASTALLNLQNTVQSLRDTQQQISTGLKIGSAADNAAYFAISTVLKSDSNALSTVSDTLSLGGSSLDVATNALDKIQTTLSDIKAQLLAATTPGIDRVKIQAQIAQDQAQLKNISDSANFNGQNVLSVNSASATYNPSQEFVSSYSRDPSGAITVGMISVDLTKTTLFDSNGNIGILDKVDTSTIGSYQPAQTGAAAVTSNAAGTGASIYNMDIHALTDTPADQATLNAYQKQVDAAISTVTAAASEIGTARARITQQQSFVSSLQTSIDNGVGSLVDADLNTASTRLQALQVQQQLGVQSLSIANQSTQMVLKLFQ